MKHTLPTVDSAIVINLPKINDDCALVIAEAKKHVPFDINRIFFVSGVPAGSMRGHHAHRQCHQLLICPIGVVSVVIADGSSSRTITLDTPEKALHIPPGLWAEEIYRDPTTVLLVLCDRPYEPEDYIRDMAAYRAWRQRQETQR
jgi:dTDP-4-dehydrorhamnose 3,5-epimerase-like enzyme